jgi:hypothetical protein
VAHLLERVLDFDRLLALPKVAKDEEDEEKAWGER